MTGRVFSNDGSAFRADVDVPGDKSLSHRALLLAALADGTSLVANASGGLDVSATFRALGALGVTSGHTIVSPGAEGWAAPDGPIDCGNSGTTMRLLAGAVAARPFVTVLVGDESLSRRPMRRLVGPLGLLGARIMVSPSGTPPVRIDGAPLTGAEVVIDVASAQVRTAVALAALQATGDTVIDSPPGFRDHTERWLEALGLAQRRSETRLEVSPAPVPPIEVTVPGDPSSAAFLWASAAITPGAVVRTRRVSLNPGRLGFLDALEAMGAAVERTQTGEVLGDPIGDVEVRQSALRAVTVSGPAAVATMDEAPLLAVVGAFAEGETIISGAAELRTKETDRISGTVDLVRALGGSAEATADGFVVTGRPLTGGRADARGDHRLAMAAAVAASGGCRVSVEGFASSAVSWPGFDRVLEQVWSSR
jgi:3-phosphoshikimate 1-carboxyvinyltransferase